MSKTVYINKSVLKTSATLSAYGNSGKNTLKTNNSTGTNYVNRSMSCLAYPCTETTYTDKPIVFSNANTSRGTNITDIGIIMTVNQTYNGIDFKNSAFYKYRDKFALTFSFVGNYKTIYNSKVYTYTNTVAEVTIPATEFVIGEEAYQITSTDLFGKLVGEKHSSSIYGAPNNDIWYFLESISLDPDDVAILANETGGITTAQAAEIFVDLVHYFSDPKLRYTQSKPNVANTSAWQKEFSLPETSKAGSKLFLKEVNFDYPRQFPVYTIEPTDSEDEYRVMYQAPISSRSYSNVRSLNFSYYSPDSPARIISDFTDTLDSSSSEEFNTVYPYWVAGYREVFTVNTKLPYRDYVHQSFYNSCMFEFTLSNGTITSTSLWDFAKKGITLPAGITFVKLSGLYLPNIEGFVLNNYFLEDSSLVNNLEPRHFYSALSAFSKINLDLNIGYQSASAGIYIDTTKVRKLYIDEAEIESFIAD